MAEHQCLYERAAAAPCAPLLHVGAGHMIASGQADHLSSHQGGVPVYLVGLYGKFLLRMAAGRWQSCRTAIVPPGMLHELKFHDEPFVAFYIEPCTGGLETLKPLMRGARDSDGAWIGSGGEISLMRALYEDRSNRQDAGAILDDLLGFAQKQVVRTLDPRVARVAESLREGSDDDLTPVACKAAAAGLSSSRFQHLFSNTLGFLTAAIGPGAACEPPCGKSKTTAISLWPRMLRAIRIPPTSRMILGAHSGPRALVSESSRYNRRPGSRDCFWPANVLREEKAWNTFKLRAARSVFRCEAASSLSQFTGA